MLVTQVQCTTNNINMANNNKAPTIRMLPPNESSVPAALDEPLVPVADEVRRFFRADYKTKES